MPRKFHRIVAGTWYAVPIASNGWVPVLLSRTTKGGAALGYFFGPSLHTVPSIEDVSRLMPMNAEWIAQIGDLHIQDGTWKENGRVPSWDVSVWPVPNFARLDRVSRKAWVVRYSDGLDVVSESQVDPEVIVGLPQDGLWGAKAVELYLNRLFG